MQSLGAHVRSAHWLLLLLQKGYTPSQLKEQGYDPAAVNGGRLSGFGGSLAAIAVEPVGCAQM